jgi:hypothetical protein
MSRRQFLGFIGGLPQNGLSAARVKQITGCVAAAR